MKIQALKVDNYYLYSRCRHDFRSFLGFSVDGGPGVERVLFNGPAPIRIHWIEIPDITYADLYNDWNFKEDKYGIHEVKDVKVLDYEPDIKSIAWKAENQIWITNGKDGNEQSRAICLNRAETSHLEAILENCPHISNELRQIINHILKSRNEK